MGQLMLRCPMTDRNFSTGIDTDRESLKSVPYTGIAVRCPYCGCEHTWGPRDAPLAECTPSASGLRMRDDPSKELPKNELT
jgi:hypothetical protein